MEDTIRKFLEHLYESIENDIKKEISHQTELVAKDKIATLVSIRAITQIEAESFLKQKGISYTPARVDKFAKVKACQSEPECACTSN